MALIEQSEAIKALNQLHPGIPFLKVNIPKWEEKYAQYLECERAIKELTSVDAMPVVHGRWNPEFVPVNGYGGKCLMFRCSACSSLNDLTTPYCCICGARMDGKDDDNDKPN